MIIGIFLLLLGLSIILKAVFKVDIPIIRIVFAGFLIYLGFKILLGGCWPGGGCRWNSDKTAIFSSQTFKAHESAKDHIEYHIVFGKGVVDLSELSASERKKVEINTVFGETDVILDPKKLYRIRTHAVFGETTVPDGRSASFGNIDYQSPATDRSKEVVAEIEGNVVFGTLRFR